MDHIKPLRLFDLSQVETRESGVTMTNEEEQHLRECGECQHVLEVFARQFIKERPPHDKTGDAA